MRNSFKCLAVLAVMGLTSIAMAEQIDNPEYKDWARFKAGTSITMKQATQIAPTDDAMAAAGGAGMPAGMDLGAMMPQTSTKTTLTVVKADVLTLEVETNSAMFGQVNTSKTTREIPAKIDKPTTAPATAPAATQAVDLKDLKEGKETLDVNGKKIDTITREYTTTGGAAAGLGGRAGRGARGARGAATAPAAAPAAPGAGGESHVKVWTSSEVPNGMVKMETTTNSPGMGDMKVSMTLVDFTTGR